MTHPLIQKIHDDLPGYREACDAHAQLLKAPMQQIKPGARISSSDTVALDMIIECAASGGDMADLPAELASRLSEIQAAEMINMQIRPARDLLKARQQEILRNNDATILKALHAAIEKITVAAAEMAPLDQIATEEATARSKRFEDADQLRSLVAQVSAIRVEQSRITREYVEVGSSAKLEIAQHLRNVEDVFPDWRIWLQFGYRENSRSQERRHVQTPWPEGVPRAGDAFITWSLTSAAELWVPTPGQHTEYAEKLKAESRKPRTEDPRHDGDYVDPALFALLSGSGRVNW